MRFSDAIAELDHSGTVRAVITELKAKRADLVEFLEKLQLENHLPKESWQKIFDQLVSTPTIFGIKKVLRQIRLQGPIGEATKPRVVGRVLRKATYDKMIADASGVPPNVISSGDSNARVAKHPLPGQGWVFPQLPEHANDPLSGLPRDKTCIACSLGLFHNLPGRPESIVVIHYVVSGISLHRPTVADAYYGSPDPLKLTNHRWHPADPRFPHGMTVSRHDCRTTISLNCPVSPTGPCEPRAEYVHDSVSMATIVSKESLL